MFDIEHGPEVAYLDPEDAILLPNDDHDPRIAELEATLAEADTSAKEIEIAMRTYNKALAKIKLQLDNLADNIESAEYFYRDDEGNLVPGVKAIEYDLSVTTDPEKVRILEKQLEAAKARMARFVDLYQEFSKTTGPRREKIEQHLAQLDTHLIALSHQRKMTKKQLDDYIASQNAPKDYAKGEEFEDLFFLAPDRQRSLVTALEAYINVSPVEAFAEIDQKASKLLRDSVRRYRENPKKELVVVKKALESTASALSAGEVELLYEQLSHRDSTESN